MSLTTNVVADAEEDAMYPTITVAVAREHREDLLRQAHAARRAAAARHYRDRAPELVRPRRVIIGPLVVARGWLARGYL
ncbi:MAG: hypothetical protein ABI232_06325 [Jatrophihabitantaceae bacterium]